MKVGERGQITIPKAIRDQFGIGPDTEVRVVVENGEIIVRKVTSTLALEKWIGHCGERFREMGFDSVDEYVSEVRGR